MSTTLSPDTRDALLAELRARTTSPGFHYLSPEHIARLNEAVSDGPPVVSLYLSLAPEMRIGGAWEPRFRKLCDDAVAGAGEHADTVRAACERVSEALASGLPRTGRGVAFFVCEAIGLFEQLGTAIDLPTSVHLDRSPHVRPLARVRDENDRFVIALVSAHQSRFFFSQIGLVEEVYELAGEEVAVTDFASKDQRQAIAGDLRRAMAGRSAHAAQLIVRTLDARHLLVSAPPDMEGPFLDGLEQSVRQRLAGRFACDLHATTAEVAQAAEAAQRETEAREEIETLGRVEQLLASRAVAGLESTLEMLNQQRVMTLVVDDEARVPGGIDAVSNLLTTQTSGTFEATGGAVEPVDDLVEHMLDRAMQQGAALEIIRSDAAREALRKHGPTAALLRF